MPPSSRGQVLAGLKQTDEFAEIDYQSVVNRIADLRDEHSAKIRRRRASSPTWTRSSSEVKWQIKASAEKSSRS